MSKQTNDLLVKRGELLAQHTAIQNDETKLAERKELLDKVENIDAQIDEMKRAETLASKFVEERQVEVVNAPKDFNVRFLNFLNDQTQREFKVPVEKRANPLLSTTNATMLNKTVDGNLSIAQLPGFSFLSDLGVPTMTGINGKYVKVSLNQNKAKFVNENSDASAGDLAPATLELSARTLSHFVDITKETIDMTNPSLINQSIDSLHYGLGIAVVEDLFKQFEIDAVDSSVALARTLVYRDLINLDASIPYVKKNFAYVTTPSVASALMTTAGLTNQAPIWSDNDTIRGKKAFQHELVPAKRIYAADWSQAVVAQFGEITYIKDIYGDNALKNKQRVYATMEIDCGFVNDAFSKWISDASI